MCGGLYTDFLLQPPPHHPTPSCMLRFIGYYGRWVREVGGGLRAYTFPSILYDNAQVR